MIKKKIGKQDFELVKAAVARMKAEGSYTPEELKESLASFKGNTVVGLFDDDGALVAWRVLDADRNVISAIGGSRKTPPRQQERSSSQRQGSQERPSSRQVRGYRDYDEPGGVEEVDYIEPDSPFSSDRIAREYGEEVAAAGGKPKKKGKAGAVIALIIGIALLGGAGYAGYLIVTGQMQVPQLPQLPFPGSGQQQQASDEPDYDAYAQAPSDALVHVTMAPGDTPQDMRQSLLNAGLVNAARDFVSAVGEANAAEKLQAGDYIVLGNESATSLVERMSVGDLVPDGVIGVNIGDNINQIADVIDSAKLPFSGADFLNEAKDVPAYWFDYKMLSDVPSDLPSLEGFFDEGEYNLTECGDAKEAVKLMLEPAEQRFKRSGLGAREWFNVLVKASLIEKEAFFDEDRSLIASVIENRLSANAPLQIDAAVKYATGSTDSRVLYENTEVDSPYNTYDKPGLPIGPICSGISETDIEAVLNPADTDYFYYVLKDKEGHHAFSSTPEDFEKDKQAYLELFGYEDSW